MNFNNWGCNFGFKAEENQFSLWENDNRWKMIISTEITLNIKKTCSVLYTVWNTWIEDFHKNVFFFCLHRVRCMLGFSCSVCAPNSNISQHEAYSPLAISFSHRAKVTWLTTVSHLTMQKDYQFVGPLSGGEASSRSLIFNRPSIMKGWAEVVHPLLFSV